ncbi:class I SAM-dependent methyltransferase [Neptunicella sp. SCSIO 80796]|uniref:class I SAM-dependent methyltransferase n=1 Tax=Neptunicella plasticusilytica TaxID=3117012 RepID=UPI003A4D3FF4
MVMPEYLLLVESDVHIELAAQIAAKWQFRLVRQAERGLVLMLDDDGLQLKQLDEPKTGGVRVDFASDALTYRRQHGGGKKEAVAKAAGIKTAERPSVLDCTAGLGRDAFILASLGCRVQMIERSPVVAALLEDGIRRASQYPDLAHWFSQRMQLLQGAATEKMQNWQDEKPDVIYLDPMFPHRKKSALVKKEMRLFQQLLGPDQDADLLLEPALKMAGKRVVVKRPAGAPYLNNQKPQIEMAGKANRFDIYLIH